MKAMRVGWSIIEALCSRATTSVIVLVMMCLALSVCSKPSTQTRVEDERGTLGDGFPRPFKVVTYNAWHGLHAGEVSVTPGESPERNEERLGMLVRQIAEERPDVVLLQEVNPLPKRAEAYVQALSEHGLAYTEIHQVDACGVRLSEERALVSGLNNGLVVLAKQELQLEKITGLKLSGDLGECESTSGVQLEELRYALIGVITLPGTSIRYLVVSLHLHSGFEAGPPFSEWLAARHQQGNFERYPYLKWEIEKTQLRRVGELDRLVRELNKIRREGGYTGVIIGGDFNFEEGSLEYEEAKMLRLVDTYTQAQGDGEIFTADPIRNRIISEGEEEGSLPDLLTAIQGESTETKDEIVAAYRNETRRPRRIDHLFVDNFLPQHRLNQSRFGTATNADGLPASDHFGIMNTYSWE